VADILEVQEPTTLIQMVLDKRKERVNSHVNYRVNICDHASIVKLLTAIEPYLVGKKTQAQVLLQLLKTHRRRTKYTKVELQVIDVLKKLKTVNSQPLYGNTEPSRDVKFQACVETLQATLL